MPDTPPADPGGGRRGRRHPLRVALLLLALVVVAVVVGGAVWYQGQVDEGPAGQSVIVNVPAGSSESAVTADLVRQQVVASGLAFRVYLTLHSTTVEAGHYQLRRHQSFGAVHTILAGGPNVFAVTVVAASLGQDAPSLSGARFLAAVTSGAVHSPWQPAGSDNLDGLLGTGTYLVTPKETEAGLLAQMIDRFDRQAARVDLTARAASDGVSPYQAVTVASIDQKEAIAPGDSAKATAGNAGPVARVIYNRLERGMPLQMDSTVLYAEGRDGGPVTPADEETPTPYNTYLNTGLTPTPICFPSLTALQAALHPPVGNWLYFELTARDGMETFSATFAGQQAAEELAKSRGLP
jgi:UPF0755 protein